MIYRNSIAIAVAAVLISSVCYAADGQMSKAASTPRYRLVNGRGDAVCERFLKNLNAFPGSEPPMVCEQKIHPTHSEFTKAEWEVMDVQSNFRLIYSAESKLTRFTPAGSVPLSYDQWATKFQQRIKSGELKPRLRKAVVALNRSGPETLISYEPVADECTTELVHKGVRGPGGYVFVLRDEKRALLDRISGLSHLRADITLFQGKPYFLHSGSDIERRGNDVASVWSIQLDPVYSTLSFEGEYVKQDRCTYHVDIDK